MTNQLKALKMAIVTLEGLEVVFLHDVSKDNLLKTGTEKTINACKEALAEAEKQGPANQKVKILYEENGIQTCEILPTTTWQSLSDDEIVKMADKYCIKWRIYDFDMPDFARAIEKALKENNHG